MSEAGDQAQDGEAAVFDDLGAIAQMDVRAAVDIAAGRLIGTAAVLHWLTCWGADLPLLPIPCD